MHKKIFAHSKLNLWSASDHKIKKAYSNKKFVISALVLVMVFSYSALVLAEPGTLTGTVSNYDGAEDNNLDNANQTGTAARTNDGTTAGTVIKSAYMFSDDGTPPGAQGTHGEYLKNTNSCASCHQTHTAAAKNLLFKNAVYTACKACHDGTLGFYNLFEADCEMSSAGSFGGDPEGNPSVHLATGVMEISAAPGGYTTWDASGTDRGGNWGGEFNCASCHAPHGSYSDRLLHYNPNNMANTKPEDGGIKVDKKAVIDYSSMPVATSISDKFIAVRGTKTQFDLSDDDYANIPDDNQVIMIYEKTVAGDGSLFYEKTTNPWIYGYKHGYSGNNRYYYTRFFFVDPATAGLLNDDGTYPKEKADQIIDHYDYESGTAHIEYAKGLIYGPAAQIDALAYAEIGRAYVVKLDLLPVKEVNGVDKEYGGIKITTVNQRALFAGETHIQSTNIWKKWGITPGAAVTGWGVAMTKFCTACHVDYLATASKQNTGNDGEGIFHKAYRHTTSVDSFTCVRCHFAHGTAVEIMRDAQFRTVTQVAYSLSTNPQPSDFVSAKNYMLDLNPSSALKRYTNMSVCWACHTSYDAEQLVNTDSYEYRPDGSADPRGLPEYEGRQNWPR